MKTYYVYMLCNKRNGTLYVGVTSDLIKKWERAWKLRLIGEFNPASKDLYNDLEISGFPPSRE